MLNVGLLGLASRCRSGMLLVTKTRWKQLYSQNLNHGVRSPLGGPLEAVSLFRPPTAH